jgi:predicted nucleic acid-binding protein
VPLYLADTSAWSRSTATVDRWAELLSTNALATCVPVQLELLYSARSRLEYTELRRDLGLLHQLPLHEDAVAFAAQAQDALAARSQHRGPKPLHLLIAGIAASAEATLLHYDRHFDAIARVTGQQTEWLARRGSLD